MGEIIHALADTPGPANYWAKIKNSDPQLRRDWTRFKLAGKDGELQK